MKLLLVLALGLAAVAAVPYDPERIVGGSVTDIRNYPMAVSMLHGAVVIFLQSCGGSILNNRSILSAAHCYNPRQTSFWRARVGSTNAHSGGLVHNIQRILNHPNYNQRTADNDVAVIRIAGSFSFNNNVRAGAIAGPNLNTPDNAAVWVIGWGTTSPGGISSERLRHVQVWTVNQVTCRNRYNERGRTITANMLCAGWLDVGGRDACQGDSGGPLLHNNVIVGITSWGASCAMARFPGVYARVSRFSNWIQNNA